MSSPVRVKDERQWDDTDESGAGLYTEHEIKDELVLGPEQLQPQDIAFALHVSETVDETKFDVTREQLAAGAEDGRPKKEPVQSGGADSVLRPCTVKQECISNEGLLHSCTVCHKTFLHEASLETHVCKVSIKSSYANEDVKSSYSLLTKTFDVFVCVANFNSDCTQGDSEIPELYNRDIGDATCSNTKIYICDNCGEKFAFKSALVRHLKINIEEPHVCKICEKFCMNICSLHNHVCVHFTCDICHIVFKYESHFNTHKKAHLIENMHLNSRKIMHTAEKPTCESCGVCKKQFSYKSALNMHLSLNTREKPFTCDVCKKPFSRRSALARHLSFMHTGEKRHTCDVCKKQFAHKSYLAKHQRLHTGEKPFTCDVCKKEFAHQSNLITHRRLHTGEKPFSCDVCKKQFPRKSNLARHHRLHTGEKPFTCDVCKRQFANKSNLIKHRILHTGEKPFSCDVCKKQFSRKSYLVSHQRLHTRPIV